MHSKIKNIAQAFHPAQLSALATYLLKDEAISGKLILGATILALIAANTALRTAYDGLWNMQLSIGVGDWVLSKDLRHWIDEGLMAIFFLVVGLELKRELVKGELRRLKTASLPFAAALGGMVVPAVLYLIITRGTGASNGWAIPMATDIAFAVAILAFVGKGIPASIRLFLLTLAIVDDIGAVVIIALFYSSGINLYMLGIAATIALLFAALHTYRLLSMPLFVGGSILLWLAVEQSGIHASIAGAVIGLLAPLATRKDEHESIAERLEKRTIPLSTLIVVPLFAFASTGIAFSLDIFSDSRTAPIAGGIILGLVVGKVLGIVGASWLMIRLKISELPSGSSWNHVIGVGLLAGIGFTVSIFVTELAFEEEQLIQAAKISIFIASAISGGLGIVALKYFAKK
ncbi:MAG TPA: Na+/H+ antiporter NhaA [Candidatus Saccharimonadales bacterium]